MEWFAEWFDTPYYHLLYKNRDYKEAEDFMNVLLSYLNLKQDSKILDLACGKGRHSIFMNKAGYDVVGVDLSANSIQEAKKHENNTLKFSVGDMREALFPNSFDAVFNLFTSFGYFEEEQDNLKVFSAVYNQLKNRGVFVMDFMNASLVKNHLVEKEVKNVEGIEFHLNRKVENNFIVKDIRFSDQGKDFYFQERVKICNADYFHTLAQKAGFELAEVFGDYKLSPYNEETSPRLISFFIKH